MPYCDDNDVQLACGGRQRLIELSDLESTGEVNVASIAAARVAAEGLIDGYLRRRYATPLAVPVPPLIVQYAAQETKYQLMLRRGMVTPEEKEAHELRETYFKGVASGATTLGVEPAPAKSSSMKAQYAPRDDDEDVSRESLKGFIL